MCLWISWEPNIVFVTITSRYFLHLLQVAGCGVVGVDGGYVAVNSNYLNSVSYQGLPVFLSRCFLCR